MKKTKLLLFSLICMFVFSTNIFAAGCDSEEFNDWAEAVEIIFAEDYDFDIYDENDKIIGEHKREYLYMLVVEPYIENVKVTVKDSISGETVSAKYDKDWGTYVIGSDIHQKEKKYTFTFTGGANSTCPEQKLTTRTYTMPEFNDYIYSDFCEENPFDEMCQLNYDTGDVTIEEFEEIVEKKEEQEILSKMNFFEKALYYIKKYWGYALTPVLAVSSIYIILIILQKRKADKE